MGVFQDLTGQVIHNWKVFEYCGDRYWLCKCNIDGCDVVKKIHASSLKQGTATCVCRRRKNIGVKDISGQKFGEWTVLSFEGNYSWKCQCSCDNKTIKIISKSNLVSGRSKSCGCKRIELRENTIFDRYGEVSPNKLKSMREEWQIAAVRDVELFKKVLKENFDNKPTIEQTAKLLGVGRCTITKIIKANNLEEYFDINPMYSEKEVQLYEYIRSITDKYIVRNTKSVISPYEIDIYIPDLNLAIEFNGNYWHSTDKLDKMYHFNKTMMCINKGIRLIHVFEYEWDHNREEVCSIISDALKNSNKLDDKIKNQEIIDCDLSKDDYITLINNGFKMDMESLHMEYVMTYGDEIIDNYDEVFNVEHLNINKVFDAGHVKFMKNK